MKAAAKLIVDAALSHLATGVGELCRGLLIARAIKSGSRNSSVIAGGNFGAPPKPPLVDRSS